MKIFTKYLTFLLVSVLITYSQVPNIFFSEYIEGGSSRKALEIYNASDVSVNLDKIQIAQSVNGGGWQYYHVFPAGANIAAGEVWVIVATDDYSSVSYDTTNADEVLSFPSVVHHNGDDARGLVYISGTDTTLIDVIGIPDEDPGSGWTVAGIADGTQNHTLVRKASVTSGNTDWAASAGTDSSDSEWIVYDQDTFTYLGAHPGAVQLPDPEPSEYPTMLASTAGETNIQLTWTDAAGAQPPAGYLIEFNTTGGFVSPVDGTPVGDDTDYSDGAGTQNVMQGVEMYNFTGLTPNTIYYLQVYPYTNSNSDIDYKTEGAPHIIDTTLTETPAGDPPNIFFSEYIEGGASRKALEIYNASEGTVSLDKIQIAQSVNGSGWQYYHVFPAGATIAAGEVWVIVAADDYSSVSYDTTNANEVLSYPSVVHHNGDDARGLVYIDGTDTTLIDVIGLPDEDPGSGWTVAGIANGTQNHTLVRKASVTKGNTDWAVSAGTDSSDSEWIVYDQDTFTYLGEHTTNTTTSYPDIFFSEYIEGGSNRKALEIYNASDGTVSLDKIQIAQSVNGSGWQYYHVFPSGASIATGDVYVIITDDDYTGYFDVSKADEVLSYPSVVHHNGDDARGLVYIDGTDTTLIDVIGLPDEDPGSGWTVAGIADGTQNHTLVRKASVTKGNTDWAVSAGTDSSDSEWIVYDQDTFTYLGEHNLGGGDDSPPIISSVTRNINVPNEDEDLIVDATVTDDRNELSSVNLYFDVNSVLNYIAMSSTGNDNFRATIPASSYSNGDLVKYYVVAVDSPVEGKKDTSAVYSFLVGNPDIRDVRLISDVGLPTLKGVAMRVTGVATVATGTFHPTRLEAFIQDSTAGISIFNSSLTDTVLTGNRYTVEGVMNSYNGLMQIEPPTSGDILDLGAADEVIPTEVTIPDLLANPEYYEGMLIKIASLSLSANTPWECSGSGATLTFTNDGNEITVRVDADTDICGADEPSWPVDLVGVLGQFTFNAPYSDGYQVLPRSMDDFMTLVGVGDEGAIPLTYSLEQNYPNPFNPSTTIKFSIPNEGMVSLKIYNILGEEVATLLNQQMKAAYHEVRFNASSLGSGVYFYRITSGEFVNTKKMLLIK